MRTIDRVNLGLALVLVLLLWLNRLPHSAAALPLTDMDPGRISEVRVHREGQLQLALLRDAQGWMQTHPDVARALQRRVDTLLGLLQAPVRWELPGTAGDLAHYGLDHPALSLSFDATTLHFGAASAPAGQRYVTLHGRVFLIDDAYYRIASLPARHYLKAD